MASNLKYSIAQKAAQQNALTTVLGSGALLLIYAGTQPATPDTAATGSTLLATLTCATPFAPTTTTATLTLGTITGANAVAAGTAAWYRITTSAANGNVAHIDGTVGTTASDLILTNTNIAVGQAVSVSSSTYSNAQ